MYRGGKLNYIANFLKMHHVIPLVFYLILSKHSTFNNDYLQRGK